MARLAVPKAFNERAWGEVPWFAPEFMPAERNLTAAEGEVAMKIFPRGMSGSVFVARPWERAPKATLAHHDFQGAVVIMFQPDDAEERTEHEHQ